jgi:hypothetical protein
LPTAPENLTLTLGYRASAADASIAAGMFSVSRLLRLDEFRLHVSTISVSCGWRSAMRANLGIPPPQET